MQDLKDQLASLRIDRDAPRRGRWRWLFIGLFLAVAAAGAFYFARAKAAVAYFAAPEVETVQASVQSSSGANAGTPILTASGYLVARRQSVVSSKIQGRHFLAAGGRRQRREGRRRSGYAGQCRLAGRDHQSQSRHRILQSRSGRSAAPGAFAGRPL